ncbi:VTT domain-containing protein [Sulfuriflexus sp.]|uniref:VTT domain-containing protein n=1 Tax=Sulfuriflexus sp. TaxID=2015443 RepID=UPI0028CFD103|nr:VTT domain-containing protein [Sulfuriflexus sp.]MDT8405098.1 VTT domain-containing protein [Sulfuriflexus sp.]
MKGKLFRYALLLMVIVGITLAVIYRDLFDAAALEQWVDEAGAAGPVLFMLVYALGTVFFLPGSVLTLAGGAIFGPVLGTFYNLTGATLGATLAFLIARYLAAGWVERKTGGRLKQLKEGVEGEGWRFVAFVRLVPLFPFNLLNYALGLTRIKLSHYIIASYLCMLPGAIAYTYLGYAGREAVAGGEGLIQKIMLALALLAVVGFLPGLIGRLRRGPMMTVESLKQRLDDHADILVLDVRSTDEFIGEQGHITNAVNIPLEELASRLDELSDRLEHPIAIVCRTDRRSAKAALLLAKKGFADVHVVKGGMTDWNRKAYPVE